MATGIVGTLIPHLSAAERPVAWNIYWAILWAEIALMAISLFTWPRFLAPSWYRDWLDRGGTLQTPVFSPQEEAAGLSRPVNRYYGDDREAGWLLKKITGGARSEPRGRADEAGAGGR